MESPTLRDVMIFLTGSETVPPLGYGDVNPAIVFTDDDQLPTVSTCSLSLCFPRHNMPTNYDEFKARMNLVILGSHGFGTV